MMLLSSYVYTKGARACKFLTAALIILVPVLTHTVSSVVDEAPLDQSNAQPSIIAPPKRISSITVTGNKFVPASAILDRLPYKEGELYDPTKSRTAIHNLYYGLRRFRTIDIFADDTGPDSIGLEIAVQEKKPLKDIIITGNKQLSNKEINEKLKVGDIRAIDPEELAIFAVIIKKAYADKGYNLTEITTELTLDENDRATAYLHIKESKKARVQKILFTGNHHIAAKKLRDVIFTREDWLFGFLDKSGTFLADRLEGDKHMLEQFYQNSGYLNAKVVDIDVAMDPATKQLTITYDIQEGDRYTIKDVSVSGNNVIANDYLTSIIPIRPGNYYSRQRIIDAIKTLETIWGDLGYLYTHIEPSIQPNDDDKTVSLAFYCDIGTPVYLNKIIIRGNKKTRDKVLRRKISLQEGALITNSHMEASKGRVESLGYFDQRDGVNWKTIRLDENTADLELVVKEIKTGNAHIKIGFGGSLERQSIANGVTVEANVADTNLFGSGIRTNLTARLGANEKTANFNITQPWLFDKPIYGSLDLYHKRFGYDQLSLTPAVNERYTGGLFTSGLVLTNPYQLFNEAFLRFSAGFDAVDYGKVEINDKTYFKQTQATIPPLIDDPLQIRRLFATNVYNDLLCKLFEPGKFFSFSLHMGKDKRNHPMHPTRGIAWLARSLVAAPSFNSHIGFCKVDLDVNWFTPLIGDWDLIFRLHGYIGIIHRFNKHIVPYRELFHIGGPASIRGFLFGQIGPQFQVIEGNGTIRQDSIGATRAFYLNLELIFPITNDFSLKGLVFYDGGAGWNNPYEHVVPGLCDFLRNEHFNYRHAVGVGLRILNPMPIRIDWGFKLDPRKNETSHEVHFSMSYDW